MCNLPVFQILPVLPPEADKNLCGRTNIGPSPPCRTGNFGARQQTHFSGTTWPTEIVHLSKSAEFCKELSWTVQNSSKLSLQNLLRYLKNYKMDVPKVGHVMFSFQNCHTHVVILPQNALFKGWNYRISWGRTPRPPGTNYLSYSF